MRTAFLSLGSRLLFLGFCQLLGTTPAANACQCGGPPEELVAEAEFIFSGAIVEVWPVLAEEPEFEVLLQRAEFRVERVWKGDLPERVVIHEPASTCAVPL